MNSRLMTALAASALAAPALASPFSVGIVDAEGTVFGHGQPYTITGGTFIDYYGDAPDDPNLGLEPPNPVLFATDPQLEFDSYLAMDGGGPSTQFPMYRANNQSAGNGIGFSPSTFGILPTSISAAYFHPGPFLPSGLDASGNDVMFFGRIAVTGGATIINNAIDVMFGGVAAGTRATFVLDGPAVNAPDINGVLQPMTISSTLILSSSTRGGAGIDVYDIWAVAVVPTPGAGVLMSGAMGLAVIRRRR
ncbi:MAG TPA: hypothetical protein VG797_11180 [Phycisphaerales bacterium]|nr:hypothetical protein [Phycisphaerales bacterium]